MARSRKTDQTPGSPDVQKAVETLRRHQRRLLDNPSVTSVGVGFRQKSSTDINEVCIQCTVGRKLAPEALLELGVTPLPKSLPAEDGTQVPIDVVERTFRASFVVKENERHTEQVDFHKLRRSFADPMVPGISVCNITGSAGTIGAFCYDNVTGEPLLLSNWHVLHGNRGSLGDVVVQPGPFDDPRIAGNECGTLLRSHLGFAGDCAVARINGRAWESKILEIGRIPRRLADPELGDQVVKSGRTTGVTYGVVSRIDVVVKIDYEGTVGVQEVGGFEIRPNPAKLPPNGEISQGGDSGSLWMVDVLDDDTNSDVAVGLHFAGETESEPEQEHAVACKLTSVADKLQVSLEPPASQEVPEAELWREVMERLNALEGALAVVQPTGQCACSECGGAEGHLSVEKPNAGHSSTEGIPVHGNWCGPGHGGGTPVDALDEACMRHDQCYDRNGYFDCDCDGKLVREVTRLLGSTRLTGRARAKAAAVAAYFSSAPCVRHVRIGGRTVPLPSVNNPIGGAVSAARSAASSARRRVSRALGF